MSHKMFSFDLDNRNDHMFTLSKAFDHILNSFRYFLIFVMTLVKLYSLWLTKKF